MTKGRSRSLFIVFTIILTLCLIACFVNFTYPLSVKGKYYSYSSFVSNLKLGEDVGGSLRVVYRAAAKDEYEDPTKYYQLMDSTMDSLEDIVKTQGYQDVTVVRAGDDQIIVTVGNMLTIEDINEVESLIGNPTSISFSTDSAKSDIFATGRDIKKVSAGSNVSQETGELIYYTMIEFKDDVKSKVEEKGAETIYINIGEQQLEWTYGAENGQIPISLQNFESLQDAITFANQIKTGTLDLSLTQLSSGVITSTYGVSSGVLLGIAMVLLIVAAFVFLIVKYKHAGLLACYNLLFFIVISLFLLQSIPVITINFSAMIAMLVSFILAVDYMVALFEDSKKYYNNQAKLYVAFRESQKKNLFKFLCLSALCLVSGFICLFMPVPGIKAFGWVALICSIVSMFTNLALMRVFIKMYLAFNNENGKKCNFHKGGKHA